MTPLKISEHQLQAFRSLRSDLTTSESAGYSAGADGSQLVDNYRPLQNSTGRIIRYHPDWEVWILDLNSVFGLKKTTFLQILKESLLERGNNRSYTANEKYNLNCTLCKPGLGVFIHSRKLQKTDTHKSNEQKVAGWWISVLDRAVKKNDE